MPVTDKQVAVLRAQLANQPDEHKRLFRQLDWPAEGAAYKTLIDAGFFKAVDRRFGASSTTGDVIEFVGDVRSRLGAAADKLDPQAAERLIGKVLGRGSVADLDANVTVTAEQFVLAALIADEQLDDTGLDAFMTQARKLADQWLN